MKYSITKKLNLHQHFISLPKIQITILYYVSFCILRSSGSSWVDMYLIMGCTGMDHLAGLLIYSFIQSQSVTDVTLWAASISLMEKMGVIVCVLFLCACLCVCLLVYVGVRLRNHI